MKEDAVEVLKEVPGRVLRAGYVDAYHLYGQLHMRRDAIRQELKALPRSLNALVRVFALGEAAAMEDLALTLSARHLDALRELGILLVTDGRGHSGALSLVPVFGQLAFVPAPPGNPLASFGDETAALLARAAPPRGGRCLVLWSGPGLLTLRAASTSAHVVAVESSTVAVGCAELNMVMNGYEDRVELRHGTHLSTIREGERFDHVLANPPLMPFPDAVLKAGEPGGTDDDQGKDNGQPSDTATDLLLSHLPALLAPGGAAQIVGADIGTSEGPLLLGLLRQLAKDAGLSVVLTIVSSTPLSPASRMMRALTASASISSGLPVETCRGRILSYLRARSCGRLYLFFITVSQCDRPELAVARPDTFGRGFWYRP